MDVDSDGVDGQINHHGPEAALLAEANRENLALTAMRRLARDHALELPPVALTLRTVVPVARGLGSSAAALAAGLVAADHLLKLRLSVAELYGLAWRMEGHGDNVGAALYGGAVLAVPGVREPVRLLTHNDLDLIAVVFVPEVTGATWAARAALPATVPHPDAAFNVAAVGGLLLGLHTGDRALIAAGMHDRLHEPYRARLFPHLEPLVAAARHAGALGACLSGAGPSVLALVESGRASAVATAYEQMAHRLGLAGAVMPLSPANRGAHVAPLADIEVSSIDRHVAGGEA
jgi:homoserine kinase